MIDYKAVAYLYGVNSDRDAKRIFAKALDITRRTAGDLPQHKLENEFGEELLANYQDLLELQKKGKYREAYKENDNKMKNKTKIREYLEEGMGLDKLIENFDLEEEISTDGYSQSIQKKNTVKGKDLEKDEACGTRGKKKEYASADGKPNEGDLVGTNGYGAKYYDDGTNSYGTGDDKERVAKADPYANEDPDGVNIGEAVVREKSNYFIVDILKNKTVDIKSESYPDRNITSYYLTFKDGGEISIYTKNADITTKDITKGSPTAKEVFDNIEDFDVFAIDTAWIMNYSPI